MLEWKNRKVLFSKILFWKPFIVFINEKLITRTEQLYLWVPYTAVCWRYTDGFQSSLCWEVSIWENWIMFQLCAITDHDLLSSPFYLSLFFSHPSSFLLLLLLPLQHNLIKFLVLSWLSNILFHQWAIQPGRQ